MAKSSEMFLKVPQGPPGAPLAENKLLWKRRATLAGEMQEQKKVARKVYFSVGPVFFQDYICCALV